MSLPMPTTAGSSVALDPKQLAAMEAPLIALTQQCGDLRTLLHAFFSFLNRRTDFYLVPHPEDVKSSGAKMGFPEGDAEKLLIAAFRQFPLRRIPKGGIPSKPSSPPAKQPKAKTTPKPATETKPTTAAAVKTKTKTKTKTEAFDSGIGSEAETSGGPAEKETGNSTAEKDDTNSSQDALPSNMKGVRHNEDGLQIPVGNGGSTPRYKWTQTIDETTVMIGVPKDFKGKDFSVSITSTKVSVKAKRSLPTEETPRTFLEGKLVDGIRADDSTWSLEGGVLSLTLEKARKKFWKAVCEDDLPEYAIDTELVDSRRRIDEYDDATQAQFRKCIFDQNQYHSGGPTSDEILGKTQAIPGLPTTVQYRKDALAKTPDTGSSSNPAKTELPPGVEFIDRKTLDEAEKGSK